MPFWHERVGRFPKLQDCDINKMLWVTFLESYGTERLVFGRYELTISGIALKFLQATHPLVSVFN
jgi:hypothetical protein